MSDYTKVIGRRVRRSKTAEYFTPEEWVNQYIDHYGLDKQENTCFIDPTGGSGIWLKRLNQNEKPIFYTDIVPANCIEAILNLYGGITPKTLLDIGENISICPNDKIPIQYSNQEGFKEMYMIGDKIVLNIICADASKFSFGKIFGWQDLSFLEKYSIIE